MGLSKYSSAARCAGLPSAVLLKLDVQLRFWLTSEGPDMGKYSVEPTIIRTAPASSVKARAGMSG
jgi:hypothetical protein